MRVTITLVFLVFSCGEADPGEGCEPVPGTAKECQSYGYSRALECEREAPEGCASLFDLANVEGAEDKPENPLVVCCE